MNTEDLIEDIDQFISERMSPKLEELKKLKNIT